MYLSAHDEESDYVQGYKLFFLELLKDQCPTVGAFLWCDIVYVDHAKIFFEKLLKNLPSNHSDILFIYNYIGAVHNEKHEWDLALENYSSRTTSIKS